MTPVLTQFSTFALFFPFLRAFSTAQLSMAADSPPDIDLLCLGTLLQAKIRGFEEGHRPRPAAFFSAINQ
jgi:hypothetical protein